MPAPLRLTTILSRLAIWRRADGQGARSRADGAAEPPAGPGARAAPGSSPRDAGPASLARDSTVRRLNHQPRHVRVGLGMIIALALWALIFLAGYALVRVIGRSFAAAGSPHAHPACLGGRVPCQPADGPVVNEAWQARMHAGPLGISLRDA
ncbi:hypothetical protein AAFN86_19860 [Roseomonas sp. CAU 1739]|uniref:hypothetical protein n=1 Tax=Roseomonas sp. CAU 1739 TaxID=3140364 RepID=UPI00325AE3FC